MKDEKSRIRHSFFSVFLCVSVPLREIFFMTETADVTIVGGGAAGLAAAIFSAQAGGPSKRIVVLDGAKSLGAKILVSGGGRCNVTHDSVSAEDFNGTRHIVRHVLAAFNAQAAVRWFASLGVQLKREETGKLFPVSDSARTVLNALLQRCTQLGVNLCTGCRVVAVRPSSDGTSQFTIEHEKGALLSRRAVLATGGRSLPKSGSDGSGWEMVRKLGHRVTPTFPALVPLVLDSAMFHAELSGIAQAVELSTVVAGKRVDRRTGSLLWTHFGVSGPVVLDASRHWTSAHEAGGQSELRCNFLPPDTFESAERWVMEAAGIHPRTTLVKMLAQRLPERVAEALLHHVGVNPATPAGQLPREARRTLIQALVTFPLPVVGPRGWNYAEVTAGGVPLSEIDYRTMESRLVPGLYLAGEMLDCDGRIGGFNFQWAWATGYLAGSTAGRSAGLLSSQ